MSTTSVAENAPEVVRPFLAKAEKQLYVDGRWVPAAEGRSFESENPADESRLATLAHAGREDVDRAVAAATAALDGPWGGMHPSERGRAMLALAELVEANSEELAILDTLDVGKPLEFARGDLGFAAAVLRYFAGAPERLNGTLPPSLPGRHVYLRREPVGVCGLIVAWNFPFLLVSWKIAPALAAGNTAVVKPAEQTPLSAIRFAELVDEAGILPPGVLNVLTGDGETGAALVDHPGVHKISFTGSNEVGRKIMVAGARTMKRVTLELGGKSPHIVFADADLDASVEAAMLGAFANSGQVCSAGSRLLVQDSIQDRFLERLVEATSGLTIGPGLEADSLIGPVVSSAQLDRVRSFLDLGRQEGFDVAIGGSVPERAGHFVEPTIFTNVRQDSKVVQEEIFGPVVTVQPFSDADEALEIANDSRYGLAAGVWTQNLSRAHTLAAGLKAGSVWINGFGAFDASLPFGGFKDSGYGRDLGEAAVESYTELKTVSITL
jgi:phenylacetaldehyde dehydrogenase